MSTASPKQAGKVLKTSFLSYLDSFFSQTRVVEVNGVKRVVKNYRSEPGLIKWFLIRASGVVTRVYPYTLDPAARMKREVEFMTNPKCPVKRPRVIEADWNEMVVVREYVEGRHIDPANPAEYSSIGRTLAELHTAGFALGDSKIYNFIITPGGSIYVVDGEQAIETSDTSYMYWDLIVFTITSTYVLIEKQPLEAVQIARSAYRELLESYISNGGETARRVLAEHEKFNYKPLLYILLPLPYNIIYSKIIRKLYSSGLNP